MIWVSGLSPYTCGINSSSVYKASKEGSVDLSCEIRFCLLSLTGFYCDRNSLSSQKPHTIISSDTGGRERGTTWCQVQTLPPSSAAHTDNHPISFLQLCSSYSCSREGAGPGEGDSQILPMSSMAFNFQMDLASQIFMLQVFSLPVCCVWLPLLKVTALAEAFSVQMVLSAGYWKCSSSACLGFRGTIVLGVGYLRQWL